MNLSKLEPAQRQMDCAIGLYFAERDEVSIHTLVGAAYLVLSDLSKAAKKDSPPRSVRKPEHRGKFEGAIRASQNFFKHADRGSEAALLDFNPHETAQANARSMSRGLVSWARRSESRPICMDVAEQCTDALVVGEGGDEELSRMSKTPASLYRLSAED